MSHAERLKVGSLELSSRLFLGTSGYPDLDTLALCCKNSETEMVTVGIRRIDLAGQERFSFLRTLLDLKLNILPNTAGCYTAQEAIITAELAREALHTNRIKLEVIGDDYTLSPDSVELLKAALALVRKGFEVYPYCPDDIVICRKLADIGCVCVMPLAAPIGSGRGIENVHRITLIRNKIALPIVIDAGLGTPSDACVAMELGMDAVLINTAVAKAGHPIEMAWAFKDAVLAGRRAYLAKRIPMKDCAQTSTPMPGKISCHPAS